MNKIMGDSNVGGSIFGTIGTVFIYLLAVFTVQQWAAVATIFAGSCTGAYTIYKWIKDIKSDKLKNKPNE